MYRECPRRCGVLIEPSKKKILNIQRVVSENAEWTEWFEKMMRVQMVFQKMLSVQKMYRECTKLSVYG